MRDPIFEKTPARQEGEARILTTAQLEQIAERIDSFGDKAIISAEELAGIRASIAPTQGIQLMFSRYRAHLLRRVARAAGLTAAMPLPHSRRKGRFLA